MKQTRFAMIGGGWRSEFYFRIARELPERFGITSVLVREAAKGERLTTQWGISTTTDLDSLLATKPSFVVTSTPWAVNPSLVLQLAQRQIPVLSETPPAPDLDSLTSLYRNLPAGARIQVAEQYAYQPINAAAISLVQSGKLGTVTQAQVSVAHGYHGVSLMRKLLGVQFEGAEIRGTRFSSPIVTGSDRGGAPKVESLSESTQVIATFEFSGKLGVIDFTDDQYFSWIRSRRLLVRGERGEVNNGEVRYLIDFKTPITESLFRADAGQDGNLEGYYHKGILCGSSWAYLNPFAPGRLTDDEIAVATCLQKMDEYVDGGPDFYTLAEASQDHYLALEMQAAIAKQTVISTSPQCWSIS